MPSTLTQGHLAGRGRAEDQRGARVCKLRDAGEEDPRQFGQDLLKSERVK